RPLVPRWTMTCTERGGVIGSKNGKPLMFSARAGGQTRAQVKKRRATIGRFRDGSNLRRKRAIKTSFRPGGTGDRPTRPQVFSICESSCQQTQRKDFNSS